MNIEWVKTKDIIPNTENPRVIKDDKFKKLVQSIKDFPEMLEIRPIVVNSEMMILGGNMRLKAIQEIGIKEVPIIKAENLTEQQQREFLIKDNVGFGEWDWDALANDWDPTELNEWGLDVPNMDVTELVAQEDDFDVPEGGSETDIVLGDVFDIGQHRLICGDSTQTDTFEKLTEGKLADMVITDPPYNVAYEGKTKDKLKIDNDNMGDKQFYQFLYDFYTACGAYSKPGGAWYVWHADSEGANFRQAMKDAGIMVKQCLIWVKNSMVMGRQDYQWKHEPCLYGWKEGASHNWYSDRKQTTVLEFQRPSRNAEHPTMKPVELFSYQISNSSKQGDIVMDAFGGSGTTMVACEQINRKAYVVEFDPRYCQVIVDRMKKLNPDIKIKKNGVEI
jgi:site-specific DNA-methyltransferase (adenine-specific)